LRAQHIGERGTAIESDDDPIDKPPDRWNRSADGDAVERSAQRCASVGLGERAAKLSDELTAT
jgi:hypothetical protein